MSKRPCDAYDINDEIMILDQYDLLVFKQY